MCARNASAIIALLGLISLSGAAARDVDRSTLRWESDVEASIDDVWDAFTTKAGIESWMVPVCEVELRVGGTIRTNYDRSAGVGGPGTIVHHILALEPKRMLSTRFDAPENAPVAKIAEATWVVTRLEPLSATRTRVSFTSCGWGEGPEWDKARDFFERGNAQTLDKLVAKYRTRQPDGSAAACEAIIAAPIRDVWQAWTTQSGLQSWRAPHAAIDLRIGGKLAIQPHADRSVSDAGTQTATILSYEPERMLAYSTDESAASRDTHAASALCTVLRFEPISAGKTRVSAAISGSRRELQSEAPQHQIEQDAKVLLDQLRAHFARAASGREPDNAILRGYAAFVGDHWIMDEKLPNGGVFRGRTVWEHGPDGKALIARGWLGGADGLTPHGATQIWYEPGEGVRFQSLDERGSVARGPIRVIDDRTTEWDWDQTASTGAITRFHVRLTVESPDAYVFSLHSRPDKPGEAARELVRATFRRVRDLPAEFLKLKSSPG